MTVVRLKANEGKKDGSPPMSSDYLLVRRQALVIELRWIEEELFRRGEIKKRLVAPPRSR